MSSNVKIVGGFAAVGFLLPLGILGYFALSGTMAGAGVMRICPSCMMMMALDNASITTGILVWIMICVSNAVVYALPGVGLAALLKLTKRNGG